MNSLRNTFVQPVATGQAGTIAGYRHSVAGVFHLQIFNI